MTCPKPTIAAAEGFCIGGGLGLALCCDSESRRTTRSLAIPASRLGIVYGTVDSRNLLNVVGLAAAKTYSLHRRASGGAERIRLGLIDEITEGSVMECAMTLAEKMASNAPLSIGASKEILGLPRQG